MLDRFIAERILMVVGGLALPRSTGVPAQNTALANDKMTITCLPMRSVRSDKPICGSIGAEQASDQ
jgi:hypothetical protein